MGIRSHKQRKEAHSFWLPGFEPDTVLADGPNGAVTLVPAHINPTPTAIVAAAVVHATFEIGGAEDRQLARASVRPVVVEAIEAAEPSVEVGTALQQAVDQAEQAQTEHRNWPDFDLAKLAPRGSLRARIEQNICAIERMLAVGKNPSQATDADRNLMLQYSGWGGAARLFEDLPNNSFTPDRQRLLAMVSEEEFTSARASVTSAFYTDALVIKAVWGMIRRLGFAGGRVIEPAAGTGLFLAGMPKDIALKSEITAVELDKLSAGILDACFTGLGVKVKNSALEKSNVPHGFYDLVVSNVPFGNFKSLDTSGAAYSDWSIHNYFIGKSVDLVRSGGLVVVITSSYSMDAQTAAHRTWINAHAELVSAFRLPSMAFKHSANTEVVTDILIFKKREAAKFVAPQTWTQIAQAKEETMKAGQELQQTVGYGYTARQFTKERPINEWYVNHPQAIIGELVFQKDQYGKEGLTTQFQGTREDLANRLAELTQTLPRDVYVPTAREVPNSESLLLPTVAATKGVKPGSFVLHDGRICISQDEMTWIEVDGAYSGKARERLLGMMNIRDTARELIAVQIETNADDAFKRIQAKLNVQYDSFVAKHGNVTDSANVRVFKSDPDCPLMLSLEQYDEEKEAFKKADIFSKRTAGKRSAPETVATVKDAMLVSLGLFGRIHVDDMAKRMNVRRSKVVEGLRAEGLAYVDPETMRWATASEYLSGHIRNKIAIATAAGKRFAANVEALQKVIPEKLGPGEVEIRLGAPWVPSGVIAQFANDLVGVKSSESRQATVAYDEKSATWSVGTNDNSDTAWLGSSQLRTTTWGTHRRPALELLEAALNQVPPKVTRAIHGKQVLDRVATMAAREKYEAIRQEFKAWAYRDEKRRDLLIDIYNEQFNQLVERQYDGSHLMLFGMSPVIVPYQHQLDAIWRIVSGGNTLLAHVVGAGKTFTMISAAMEMRRIGKAQKPTLVVPNHLLYQFVGDCVRFYPTAKILMATKEDFCGDRRKEFVARVATGDWDAVVMTHSTFERTPVSPARTKQFVDELKAQARASLHAAEESRAKRTVKQCEKLLKTYEAKFERALNEDGKDDLVFFDELGVDYVMYDEAHALKNLMRVSKMPSIAGLSNASSNRAFDAWVKFSLIMSARGGREEGITLSTATPISNSLAEMHVMQKYMQPQTLKQLGLYEFDAWSATFGEAVTGMELSPDGSGYRLSTRYARFTNVADLMAIYRQVADIKTRSMVKLNTPHIKGGKPSVVLCDSSDALKQYTEKLVERADAIRKGVVKSDKDNMLLVTSCGRKAALDMRLVDPTQPFDPNGKIGQLVQTVKRIWTETTEQRGTQLVFCDLSTPSNKWFSVYNDARMRMIEAGIPAEEIAFIHDYETERAKEQLFGFVRAGKIRVLFASTQKGGTGTNVQQRLKAVHQLDSPWRPSDVEQRDGRGDRAGNMWDEIELVRYITEGSFDAYIWSLLETKARFIEQVMTGGKGLRTVEDLAMGALTFAEIKALASGNPLVLEKASVDADVLRYGVLRDAWENQRWMNRRAVEDNKVSIGILSSTLAAVDEHAKLVRQCEDEGFVFRPNYHIDGIDSHSLEIEVGTRLLQTSKSYTENGEVVVGSIAGMDLVLSRGFSLVVALKSSLNERFEVEIGRRGTPLSDVFGTGKLVMDAVVALAQEPARRRERIARMRRDIEEFEASMGQPFEHEERLMALVQRQRAIESELELDKDEAGVEAQAEDTAT